MRIGSYNSTMRYTGSINRTYENQTKLMEMSDGNRLHRPSDDCVGYSKYLRHSITYGENNQYQTNVQTAISWMKNTDAALVDMAECFSKIVVKSNQADGSNSDADMRAIAGEMLVQAQQAVADANMNVNGRYLFSGQADLVQPYEISKKPEQRGLAKTLDDQQTKFFSGSSTDGPTKSGDVTQMLTLTGVVGERNSSGVVVPKIDEKGNTILVGTFYMNTISGDIYTKDFVDEGYKDVMSDTEAMKDPNYLNGKQAGTSSSFPSKKVSDYFDEYGVINDTGKNYSDHIEVDGQLICFKLTTVEQYIVKYNGDRKQFSMVKENGAAQPTSDTVNASGIEIAGRGLFDNEDAYPYGDYPGPSGANAFNDMLTVYAICDHGINDKDGKPTGPDSNWMSSDGKALANAAYNTVNSAQTKIASRQSVYKDCQAMLTTQNQQVLGDITEVHSTDVSKLAVDMMAQQTVYQLSLNIGARILPQTLTDYLR